ncbi:hypothetical protein MMC07_006460 [Pseudocyphellaria aurata]|nr:hypothetical protein [Pseudocyphellaria aurata]
MKWLLEDTDELAPGPDDEDSAKLRQLVYYLYHSIIKVFMVEMETRSKFGPSEDFQKLYDQPVVGSGNMAFIFTDNPPIRDSTVQQPSSLSHDEARELYGFDTIPIIEEAKIANGFDMQNHEVAPGRQGRTCARPR